MAVSSSRKCNFLEKILGLGQIRENKKEILAAKNNCLICKSKLSKNSSKNNLDMDYLNLGFLALELRETVSKTLSSIKNELKQSLSEQITEDNKSSNKNVSNKSESNLKTITLEELSWHDTIDDCWIAIYDYVYDCTEFMIKHPGGGDVLCEYAGRDGTIAFISTGHSESAVNLLDKYLIGELPPNERLFRSENGVKVIM